MGLSVICLDDSLLDGVGRYVCCRAVIEILVMKDGDKENIGALVMHVMLMREVPGQKLLGRGCTLKVPPSR